MGDASTGDAITTSVAYLMGEGCTSSKVLFGRPPESSRVAAMSASIGPTAAGAAAEAAEGAACAIWSARFLTHTYTWSVT